MTETISVSDAVRRRYSVRQFRPDPVPESTVREILELAGLAPSGGNLQPWRVFGLAGEPLARLKQAVAHGEGDEREHLGYPPNLWDPYRTRRYQNGEELYATIGISREERPRRLEQVAKNGDLFDAPVGLFFFIERRMGRLQWADLGMMMQNIMLLAVERGLHTCAQGYWGSYGRTVAAAVGALDEDLMLVCGMALGCLDEDATINRYHAGREPLEAWAKLMGFEQD
jgi:nitroreductase